MSIINKVLTFFFILQFGILFTNAQPNTFLDNFSAFIDQDKITLNWTISGGNTCNGIKIFHSSDSTYFTQIGFISGICGNSTIPVSYNFTDLYPLPNKINYYRLELGTLGFTDFIQIEFIKYNDDGYVIKPNPVTGSATIYFLNDLQEEFTFKLYNQVGMKVYVEENISGEYVTFNRDELPSGLYVFSLENKYDIYLSGKFIIQ